MSPVTSTARAYFEHIRSQPDPFRFLCSLADQAGPHYPFFEQEWIDFKGQARDERDAKKTWSKALSGYANITDGLIIWGIDARKTPPRNIDAASGLRLISDPSALESRLRDLIRDATNPPVMNVEYQPYADASAQGFLICLIPESSHKPHRAEFADKQYYYRAGDDFLPAEPGLLRILFYPRTSPRLEVELIFSYEISTIQGTTVVAKIHVSYLLHNTGTATAKDVFTIIQHNQGASISPRFNSNWRPISIPSGKMAYECKSPIHPGALAHVFDLSGDFFVWSSSGGNDTQSLTPNFSPVVIAFDIFADNYSENTIVTSIDRSELVVGVPILSKRFQPADTPHTPSALALGASTSNPQTSDSQPAPPPPRWRM
jgi:hypothetical protein